MQFPRCEEPRPRGTPRQVKAGVRPRSYSCGLERPRAEVPAEFGRGEGAQRVGTSGPTDGTNTFLGFVGPCLMHAVSAGGRGGGEGQGGFH